MEEGRDEGMRGKNTIQSFLTGGRAQSLLHDFFCYGILKKYLFCVLRLPGILEVHCETGAISLYSSVLKSQKIDYFFSHLYLQH